VLKNPTISAQTIEYSEARPRSHAGGFLFGDDRLCDASTCCRFPRLNLLAEIPTGSAAELYGFWNSPLRGPSQIVVRQTPSVSQTFVPIDIAFGT